MRHCLAARLWLAAAVLCGTVSPCALSAEPRALALEDIGFLPAESFDTGDGLPAISVVSAAVTPQGQVWLGTMRGLVRYNSRRFAAEAGPNGVLQHATGDLAATPDGRVWV
jgi:ligand-binding sensor domain-containing protein